MGCSGDNMEGVTAVGERELIRGAVAMSEVDEALGGVRACSLSFTAALITSSEGFLLLMDDASDSFCISSLRVASSFRFTASVARDLSEGAP